MPEPLYPYAVPKRGGGYELVDPQPKASMPINVNCSQCINSQCYHPSVPKEGWLFSRRPDCIEIYRHKDPRCAGAKCAVRVPTAVKAQPSTKEPS